MHWIDEVSELLLADFLTVIPQTPSLVVITYRPEYGGALTRVPNAQTIALAPLNGSQSVALATELIGSDPSVAGLSVQLVERAAGNPFFTEELVRDLAERGVLTGDRGSYVCRNEHADAGVPATVQATIAARIDRLDSAAKQTLNAAAVIGLRFSAEQLVLLHDEPALGPLLAVELIDQVRFTPDVEYAFHHPLIRTVTYESQLRSGRAELHRRLAAAIQQRHPDALDENAALIAEHLEAAVDLRAAYGWHLRAGAWAQYRDFRAARVSWERAGAVADRLPADDPNRTEMRIAPRTLLCGSIWRFGGSVAETGFDELRELCTGGDNVSLAIGMAGLMTTLLFTNKFNEATRVARECSRLLDSIDDPTLTVGVSIGPSNVLWQAGRAAESLRLAQRVIDLADGEPTKGNLVMGSPLAVAMALRGSNRYCLGLPGWREDFDQAIEMARTVDVTSYVGIVLFKYGFPVHLGVLPADATADRDTAEALQIAERGGDDFAVDFARLNRGIVLVNQGGSRRAAGLELLGQWRAAQLRQGYTDSAVRYVDTEFAREKARVGDIDDAIELARTSVDFLVDVGELITRGEVTRVLVEALLQRGAGADLAEAQAAIDRLAAVPTDPGFVLFEIPLLRLRALLARVNGDEGGYRDFAGRYLKRATEVGYEGHVALAEAMR